MSSIVANTLFTKQVLNFDPTNLNTQLVPVPLTGIIKFGVLDLKALSSPLTQEILEIVFQLDRSGSMIDICSDGRSKMLHIIHTISTNVTEENYKKIITKIENLTPKGNTNIGLALNRVSEIATQLRTQFPDHKINHIFMTDGEITQGETNYDNLRALVDTEITNAFIGFGINHDATLLNALSIGSNSNYYFIDKLENASLVYGEILHGIIYRFLTDVVITISEGLIYNFKTNEWAISLSIGEIVSESSKTYHIVSNSPTACSAQLICRRVLDGTEESIIIITGQDMDVTKYIFRQRTQQHLYAVKEFIIRKKKMDNFSDQYDNIKTEKNNLKQILTDYLTELKKYMEDNNLSNDLFYKNLCDDIYIAIQTFSTNYGELYVNERLTSQGTQRAYNVTNIPEQINFNGSIKRQHALCRNQLDPVNDFSDEDQYDTLNHTVSSSVKSPYRSSSQTGVMRAVSNNITNIEENEEECMLPV